LINEGCGVPLASWFFVPEDCLPAIAVASPLVEHKDSGKVGDVEHFLEQRVGQVVERQASSLRIAVS
jgi:hypothetical protein